jgi:pimeloyl-ACP methyl ester carboxylesterase
MLVTIPFHCVRRLHPFRMGLLALTCVELLACAAWLSPLAAAADAQAAGPPETALTSEQVATLDQALTGYFAADVAARATWKFNRSLDALLLKHDKEIRGHAWKALCDVERKTSLAEDYASFLVKTSECQSPFAVHPVGTRPAAGWGLVIAMHGGGGAPKALNDDQWSIMQHYYTDQRDKPGYLYCALRAPNDQWNGFYADYVYPLVARLIREFVVCADVDPQRVYLIGYSHGGYGAFAIGPKMPDRFAFIHASAAAPSDGTMIAKSLRNTHFTYWMPGLDTAYGRLNLCRDFDAKIKELRGTRTDIFPVVYTLMPNLQHPMLPDHGILAEMLDTIRNPVPTELTWEQSDSVIKRFFWIGDDAPAREHEIDATCQKNVLTVSAKGTEKALVWLDRRLIDFSTSITLNQAGKPTRVFRLKPRLKVLCDSMANRGDPDLAFTAKLELEFPENKPPPPAPPAPAEPKKH